MTGGVMDGDGEIYGAIGRVAFTPERASLRLYTEFSELGPDGTPICELRFTTPAFTQTEIDALLHDDAEVVITPGAAVLACLEGGERTLRAEEVTVHWVAYDITDYDQAVRRLRRDLTQTQGELRDARTRLSGIRSTAAELLRRAEIKAATSDARRTLQASAIEVLKRFLVYLE